MNQLKLPLLLFFALSLVIFSCEQEEVTPPPANNNQQDDNSDDNDDDDDDDDNQENNLDYPSPCTAELIDNRIYANPNIFWVDTINTYIGSNSGYTSVDIRIENQSSVGGEITLSFDSPFEAGVYDINQALPDEGEVTGRIFTNFCSICPYQLTPGPQLFISSVDDYHVFEFCEWSFIANNGTTLEMSGRVIVDIE